jgi:dTDP-4-amino-4,6-dideoxygalactose transaminase
MSSPYAVVDQFETALSDYVGSEWAVTTTSCTMAILLALKAVPMNRVFVNSDSWDGESVEIPRHTYIGVAHSVYHAGYKPVFTDEIWSGSYKLWPFPIWDSARRLRMDMHVKGRYECLSFHWSKHLGIGQGGAIVGDGWDVYDRLKRLRFDGRAGGRSIDGDKGMIPGFHAYMMPRDAAEGLSRLALLPNHNEDLAWGEGTDSNYPDLEQYAGIWK